MRRLALLTLLMTAGCFGDGMTVLEALDALEQSHSSARGEQATSGVIEISTDFTIGAALEAAAQTIADFWASQVDCAEVTLEGNTLTVDYGGLEDDCVFQGHTYAGVNTVTVVSTAEGDLEVLHTWGGFSNGDVQVDGGATVTWSGADRTRRVVTEHTWTGVHDGAAVDVWGDHVQGELEAGVPVWESGFTLEGERTWTSEGDWAMDMTALELRMIDPAPQAGEIAVTNPGGKVLMVTYERVDEDTIQATLSGLRGGDRAYHITALGQYEEVAAEREAP